VEGGLSLNVAVAIQEAARLLKEQGTAIDDKAQAELQRFFGERFRYYCQEITKLRDDVVDAVLPPAQAGEFDPLDLRARALALQSFSGRPEFDALMIAFKRTDNITKSHQDDHVDPGLFQDEVETGLAVSLKAAEDVVPGLIQDAKYADALEALVALKTPIDSFFVGVMVMAEDQTVRKNRLALLVRIRNLFRRYANFSKIRVEAR
jgi:glycyl-tRNA synthetase beta chain